MLRGKVEGEMALLSEGSSVKESPEDKQASVPCVQGGNQDFTAGHSGTFHRLICYVIMTQQLEIQTACLVMNR